MSHVIVTFKALPGLGRLRLVPDDLENEDDLCQRCIAYDSEKLERCRKICSSSLVYVPRAMAMRPACLVYGAQWEPAPPPSKP